jgi:hypothetical protein
MSPFPVGARLALEIFAEVGDDPVVIKQRVVQVEQEDDCAGYRSFGSSSFHVLCNAPLIQCARSSCDWSPGMSFACEQLIGSSGSQRARREVGILARAIFRPHPPARTSEAATPPRVGRRTSTTWDPYSSLRSVVSRRQTVERPKSSLDR